jgi:hypothetical protein
VLADELWAGPTDNGAKREGDDDGVVDLSGDRDEVRDQVERKREVADEHEQQDLVAAGDTWVAGESAEEDGAVGHEAGKRAGVAATTEQDEREHDERVEHDHDACANGEPRPAVHRLRSS